VPETALLSSALAGPINMFGGDTKANSEFGTTLKAHSDSRPDEVLLSHWLVLK
jgi:hypothetical protein